MRDARRFQKFGRGVYKCAICKRSTREAGQGNDALCPECWELAGLENSVFDNGDEAFKDGWLAKERDALFAKAVRQGSNPELIKKSFDELFAGPKGETA